MTTGMIPKKITYIPGRTVNVKVEGFSGQEESSEENTEEDTATRKLLSVSPVFVSDAENEVTLRTGRLWSQRSLTYFDSNLQLQAVGTSDPELTVENTPFSGIRILSVEQRGNGGRAWKCHIESLNYYIDLREHILLEAMENAGIEKGGYLGGEYVWGKETKEMRLIRVGSTLHAALTKSTDRRLLPVLPKKDIVRNKVYQEKNGNTFLYLDLLKGWHCTNLENLEKEESLYKRFVSPVTWEKQGVANPGPMIPTILPFKKSAFVGLAWEDGKPISDELLAQHLRLIFKEAENRVKVGNSGFTLETRFVSQFRTFYQPKLVQEIGQIDLKGFEYTKRVRELAAKVFEANLPNYGKTHNNKKIADFRSRERAKLLDLCTLLPYLTCRLEDEEHDDKDREWLDWCVSKEPK